MGNVKTSTRGRAILPSGNEARKALQAGQYVLMVCTAMTFLVFAMEVYLGHILILNGEMAWRVWFPLFYSVAGFGVTLWRLCFPSLKTLRVFQGVMWLGVLVALLGFYWHSADLLSQGQWMEVLQPRNGSPPIPAPLSFLIPTTMGLVAVGHRNGTVNAS